MSYSITIENLRYAYPPIGEDDEPRFVLDGIDLEIEAGSFVALMGPTGAGKSTLCMALDGLVPQATGGVIEGQVHVAGLNTKRHPIAELARRVGIVFQDPETQFFSTSVEAEVAFGLENLGLPRDEILDRTEWALDQVDMLSEGRRSPYHLSGGEKQRVAIASVLAMRPEVLVLDEPTSNLDPRGKTEIFAAVRRMRDERAITVVMVEHDAERVAEFADRVLILDAGRLMLDAAPQQAFTDPAGMLMHGVAVPAVSAIADRLNQSLGENFAFTRLEAAAAALARELNAPG